MSPEEGSESRFDSRIVKALKDLDDDAFRGLMVHLVGEMRLNVTGAVTDEGIVIIEAEREGSKYLVLASRDLSHSGPAGLKLVRDRAAMEGRLPVLLVTGTMEDDVLKEADRLEVSVADRPKLLLLLKKYQLTGGLLKEIDRKILEKEGSRFLPSIGRFDARMQAAEDALRQGRYQDALEELNRALEMKPEHDLAWRMKAQAHLGLGQNERALEAVHQAINIRDADPWSWYLLGVVLDELGRYAEEVGAYDHALKIRPRMPEAMLNKAATLFATNRKEEALKVLDDMVRYHPDDERGALNRGIVLRSLGRTREALEAFDSVASRDPNNVDALVHRAALLEEIGSASDAADAWKEAVQADRRRADLWLKLGEAQKSAGQIDEAAKSFGIAATLDPTLDSAVKQRDDALLATGMLRPEGEAVSREDALKRKYLDSALLLQAIGKPEEALREIERCLSFEPRAPEAFVRKASILMDLGRIEEAIATLTEAVLDNVRNEAIVLDLEALTERLGRREEALRVLSTAPSSREVVVRRCVTQMDLGRSEAALQALPRDGDEHYITAMARALALMAHKRHEDAVEALRSLDQRFPTSPHLLNALGVGLRFAGQLEEAEGVLHRAVEIEPRHADAWNNLGCVHYLEGAFDEAERCLQEAAAIDRRPQFLLNLGMCQLGKDEMAAAEASFQGAAQLQPSAEALNGLGVVAERGKEFARALDFYEAALKRTPEFRDAQHNRARVKSLLKA
ncbi:MAG TPA: tetratricopeptide repeat protein [Methanomassiliicoccales archaeon]|nr:tetratricopeptide repeat protein [Methanomassiliicoccales archaeon]